jgi:hypothetical protein
LLKKKLERLAELYDVNGFWQLKDLSSNYYVTSLAVAGFTQIIQKKTGWNPALVGFILSICAAVVGVALLPPEPWRDALGDVAMRTIQLYLFVAGGVAGVHAALRKYRPKPAVSGAEYKREFWKPWF